MKSFWKNVSSYIGFSEEKPVRSALGRSNPAATVLCDELINEDDGVGSKSCESSSVEDTYAERHFAEGPATGAAPGTGDCLLERPSSACAAGASSPTENPTNRIGTAFSDADSGHDNRDFLNSRCGKPKPDDERDERVLWSSKIGSFESLVGGIRDVPAPGGRGIGRGSTGSLLSQTSSLFCSQTRMNSVKYSDSLQLNCTEGLGFESSDEREDSVSLGSEHSTASSARLHVKPGNNNHNHNNGEADGDQRRDHDPYAVEEHRSRGIRRCNTNAGVTAGPPKRPTRPTGSFPPPLPSIARNGQPWIILRSFRTDGRFVLQEVKAPPHEILHAWRQDGRLKLQLVHREEEGLCPRADDGTANDDGIGFGDGNSDGDEATNPVENEEMTAEMTDVEIDGSKASSETLH